MKSGTGERSTDHQSLSEFVTQMGRNTTGVELEAGVRTLLWISFALLAAPLVLRIVRPLLGQDPLWFGNGIVTNWMNSATRDGVLTVCIVLGLAVGITLMKSRNGPPSTPLIAGSAVSVAGAGIAAVPTTIVVAILVANLVAVVAAAAALMAFVGFAISNWLDG